MGITLRVFLVLASILLPSADCSGGLECDESAEILSDGILLLEARLRPGRTAGTHPRKTHFDGDGVEGPASGLKRSNKSDLHAKEHLAPTHEVVPDFPDEDEFTKYRHTFLGIILANIGCLSSASGLLLMKLSGQTQPDLPFYRRQTWWFGFFFLIINASVIDMAVYSLMPLSLVAPFSGITIVFSTLIARCGFISIKEDTSTAQWVAILIVSMGVVAISVCGPKSSRELTEDNVFSHFRSPPFEIFAGVALGAIAISMGLWLCRESPSTFSIIMFANGSSIAGSLSQICLKILSNVLRDWLWLGHRLFSAPFWMSLGGLLLFATPQLILLNATLANCRVAFAVPLYQTLLIIFTILGGYTFFDEFALVTRNQMIVFSAGITLAVVGLASLASSERSTENK